MKYMIMVMAMIFSLTAATTPAGADISFSAATERTVVTPGEQVVVVATLVSNKNLSGTAPPAVSPSDAYDVLRADQNQSSSSSIQIMNGKATRKNEIFYRFIYTLLVKKPGTFSFPSLEIAIDGTAYRTNPIPFTVTNESVKNADIQAYLIPSKRSLYTGEQALLTLKIAQRAGSPTQVQRGFMLALEKIEKAFGSNFSLTRLFTNQVKTGSERINGEMYTTYILRYALFPLNPGTYSIPSMPFEYEELRKAQRRRDPFFDDFFGDFFNGVQSVPKSALTNAFSINVKQLPPSPAGFNGAVGSFTLTASIDPPSIPSGEAVTLKIQVKGATRPGSIADVVLPKLNDCEIFTPEKHTDVDTSDNGISSIKSYKYLIIPRQEGTLTVPPVTLPYFDPSSGTYRTTSSEPLTVTVTKGTQASKSPTRYMTQEEIREIGKDIRFIKTGIKLRNEPVKPYRDPLYFLLFPIPFIMVLLSVLYRFQAVHKERNAEEYTRQKGIRSAFKAVEAVRKHSAKLSAPEFVSRLSSAMEKYISNRFGFPSTGRTFEDLKNELLSRNVEAAVVNDLTAFIEQIDGIRFGGMNFDDTSRKAMIDKAEAFLASLGKTKKEKK